MGVCARGGKGCLDAVDTLGEVFRPRVPAAHDGHLARVEERVVVGYVKLGVADED